MTKKINYAIIGCGTIAYTHADAINSLDYANVAACYDINKNSAAAFAQKYSCKAFDDLSELLAYDGVDAVAICTPCKFHADVIYKAAINKKHILCEKPVLLDVNRLQELIEHCDKNNVSFAGVMQHRYNPSTEAIKRAIDVNNLGELLCGYARIVWYRDDAYFATGKWRSSRENGGSVLANQGIHYIDLLLYLFGDCIDVTGNCRVLGKDQNLADNYAAAQLTFKNGAAGNIECMTVAYPGIYSELGIHGKNGSVIVRNEEVFFYDTKGHRMPELDDMVDNGALFMKNKDNIIRHNGHARQYEDFTLAILSDTVPRFTARDALKTLQVIDAIERSSKEKTAVQL